jgi:dTDP-4-amino-4,6-dideoxygalactose transaminase
LLLALTALEIGPGDEVILPPFTFFATLGSVMRTGATPVFADIDPLSYNLDPEKFESRITPRTKAVIPVHLYGQCADMNAICEIAARHGIAVIEDAAQSFGAEYHGRRCGGFGVIGCFSFYPSKNLGTLGDGGMVTTNDDALAKKLTALRVHGSEEKYYHKYLGWNARLDAIHAAILRAKLPHVDRWISQRQAAASRYDLLIERSGLNGFIQRPVNRPFCKHTYNQYVIRVPSADRPHLVAHLKAEAISCDIYYPLCLHQQECALSLGYATGDFPVAEAAAASVLALPMFPEITEEQQKQVVSSIAGYLHKRKYRAA